MPHGREEREGARESMLYFLPGEDRGSNKGRWNFEERKEECLFSLFFLLGHSKHVSTKYPDPMHDD